MGSASIVKKNGSNLPPKSTGLGSVSVSDSVANSATESKASSGSSSSSSSGRSSCEFPVDEAQMKKSSSSSPTLLGWPINKAAAVPAPRHSVSDPPKHNLNPGLAKHNSKFSDMEMMKERFAKLLLGEDMSGSGKGVPTALAISNAITNLCATVFGQLWRLEPMPPEKKSMWRREMECLICVCDHIVELIPSWQTFPDGSKLEIMTCKPRSDLFINLPALCKLDNLLIEILDSFSNTEFWYVDQGIVASDCDGSVSFRKTLQRQEEKWWLPVPRLPPGGLQESSRKQLDHKRECTNQILKAAMSINALVLTEIEVPDSYLETLPKNGRACLGDLMYRYITSDHFSPECLLDCLDLSTEHVALEIANRVEAAIYVWRRRPQTKSTTHPNRSTTKSSWGMVKDLMADGAENKRELLAERAERLLLCLKQRFPGLTQTTLESSKIQCNKDVGKSVLESYSRVLESLAFNIVARIDDVLYVDDLTKQSDKSISSGPSVSVTAHNTTKGSMQYSVPVSSTPYRTTTLGSSPNTAPLVNPARPVDRTPFISRDYKPPRPPPVGGSGKVRRVLNNYLAGDSSVKNCENQQNETPGSVSVSKPVTGSPASRTDAENIDPQRVSLSGSVAHQQKTSTFR